MFGGVRTSLGVLAAAAGAGAVAAGANGQVDPNSGIDFVRIGAVGNAPYTGSAPFPYTNYSYGRGQVNYQYSIGRFEVTTAQFAEFYNAAFDRPQSDWLPWLTPPTYWGAVGTSSHTPGGLRWTVPAGNEMRPVGNISWRAAAMYANWLCNDKSTDRSAFLNGAYDVGTFSGTDRFTDQLTHNPGARYWIPTWDETLKAFFYDPNRNGIAQGGYWTYSDRSDQPLTPGPPGIGQANFGWRDSANSQWTIPLGAYPTVQTPWGLLDASGGTAEWSEGILLGSQMTHYRVLFGSSWGSPSGDYIADSVFTVGAADFPSLDFLDFGVRIASSVPSPSPTAFVLIVSLFHCARRRRRPHETIHWPRVFRRSSGAIE